MLHVFPAGCKNIPPNASAHTNTLPACCACQVSFRVPGAKIFPTNLMVDISLREMGSRLAERDDYYTADGQELRE